MTRNPEIGITLAWVLPNIWRLGQVKNTVFGANVFNEKLLNAAKFQGYSFYCFWVTKGESTGWGTGGGGKITPTTTTTTTQIRIKGSFCSQNSFFIFWLFSAYRKNDDLGDKIYFKILWRYNLVNKQLQCTYSLIFQEVKATRQWNLVNRI